MHAKQTVIKNKSGLHARPASDFVLLSKKFESRVTIRNVDENGEAINAKSITMLLAESLSPGTRVEVAADGGDEAAAVEALTALIDSGFGEL